MVTLGGPGERTVQVGGTSMVGRGDPSSYWDFSRTATNSNRQNLPASGGVVEVWWERGANGRLCRKRNEDLSPDDDDSITITALPSGVMVRGVRIPWQS